MKSTLTSKGQTTVPKAVREALGLKPGDSLIYEVKDGKATVRRAPTLKEIVGCLKPPAKRPFTSFKEERRAAWDAHVAEKTARWERKK